MYRWWCCPFAGLWKRGWESCWVLFKEILETSVKLQYHWEGGVSFLNALQHFEVYIGSQYRIYWSQPVCFLVSYEKLKSTNYDLFLSRILTWKFALRKAKIMCGLMHCHGSLILSKSTVAYVDSLCVRVLRLAFFDLFDCAVFSFSIPLDTGRNICYTCGRECKWQK